MKKYYMDKTSISLLKVSMFIVLLVIIVLINYCLYRNQISENIYLVNDFSINRIIKVTIIIAVSIYILWGMIYLPLWCKGAEFYINEEKIGVKTGIIIKSSKYILLKSVQKVTYVHVPLFRKTGWCFIVFNGYGSRLAFTFISQKDAFKIIRHVKEKIIMNNENRGVNE